VPPTIEACLFDLDGVLTQTAKLHAAAWKSIFDDFLRTHAARHGEVFAPFKDLDYARYVDGKQRTDGVRSFLASRGIELPDGVPSDPTDTKTVAGLAERKNDLVLTMFRERGVEAYPGSVRYVCAVRRAGLRTAVVTASANCDQILEASGMAELFEARVDGVVAERQDLRSKPAPDTFLAAARMLNVEPRAAAVFEDALAGVAAGAAGGFGLVVGVDRVGQSDALRANGADIVVHDLEDLLDGE
jgi:beta-phosphoglucomutase family hydrolase